MAQGFESSSTFQRLPARHGDAGRGGGRPAAAPGVARADGEQLQPSPLHAEHGHTGSHAASAVAAAGCALDVKRDLLDRHGQ